MNRWGRGTWIAATAAVLALAALVSGGLGGCGRAKRAPVVVIGLDGADFDLLVPWMEQGELPHLKAFLDQAALGELTTVYPILSPVCWTSAFTGVNPGKHGIFDFQKMVPGTEDLILVTSADRRATPVWMFLGDAGYRVGILNVPMTYPPDPVRGRMISGFPFPKGEVEFTYPPELQDKIGKYPLDVLGLSLFDHDPAELQESFLEAQAIRGKIAEDWVRSGRFDFLWLTFTGTDRIQHFFWKDFDENHPRHDPKEAERFGNAMLDLWKKQDAILGRILELLPDDATVLMMSDHGFDAIYYQVNMANWIAKTDIPRWLAKHAVPEMDITNGILHYRLHGGLPGSSDREAFLDKFIAAAKGLRDPRTGAAPFLDVFRREDLYRGAMVEKAPDVVFEETSKYYVTRGAPDSTDLPIIQDVWTTSFSANHRPEGIVAIWGPNAKQNTQGTIRERLAAGGDFDHARIMDVAATILALMDQPVPERMDGRPLKEGLTPDFLARHPIRVEPVEGFLLDRTASPELTPEEKERLQAVPYIR